MEIDPDLMRAMYRGKINKEFRRKNNAPTSEEERMRHYLAFSRIFQEENTILPNLYYQNPQPIVQPLRRGDEPTAALMSALLRHYMKLNDGKRQNQEAVLNARFFGLGWKKMGYRTVFMPRNDEPESKPDESMMDKMLGAMGSMFGKPDNTESKERPMLVDYETLFNDSESPMNVMLDHKADLLNCKAILHRLPRTLYDLQNYGDYDQKILDELEQKLRDKFGSRFDSRETDLHMNELHVMQRNGVWILNWIDEVPKPMRYEKSTYQGKGFLFSPLMLTNEPGVRYPTSHIKVASQTQTKLDRLASMWLELVARSTHLIAVNEKALSPGQADMLEKNLLRGILKFKQPMQPGDLQSFSSSQVPADLQNLIGSLQQIVTEVLGADEQMVAGKSQNDTLGQDELARIGSKMRQSGMQDKVRDWMIDQFRKEGTLLKQFSNAELEVIISGQDYFNQKNNDVQDQVVGFMTMGDPMRGIPPNPLGAKHFLQAEFEYDMSVEDAMKPNKAIIQKQLERMIEVGQTPQAQMALLEDNCQFKVGLAYKEWFKNVDGLGNTERFFEELNSLQKAVIQTRMMLMNNGQMGQPKGAGGGGSTESAADKGAEQAYSQ